MGDKDRGEGAGNEKTNKLPWKRTKASVPFARNMIPSLICILRLANKFLSPLIPASFPNLASTSIFSMEKTKPTYGAECAANVK